MIELPFKYANGWMGLAARAYLQGLGVFGASNDHFGKHSYSFLLLVQEVYFNWECTVVTALVDRVDPCEDIVSLSRNLDHLQ